MGAFVLNACDDDVDCNSQTWYEDTDGDGFGNPDKSTQSCTQPEGYVADNTDFDDNNPTAYPNAIEVCNGIDDNGDGTIDETAFDCGVGEVCENGQCVTATTYYEDNDGDGFGNPNETIQAGNNPPAGYVANNTDCNDNIGAVNPGATEVCDELDNNCNGTADEGVLNTYYLDFDGDDFGNPGSTITACSPPAGYVSDNSDCNDMDANTYPGAPENTTDGADNNCNGMSDECMPNIQTTTECNCSDGIDNDMDGDIDDNDSDC